MHHPANDLLQMFGPPEVALSDEALLSRADRAYRLIRGWEWAIDLREAREEQAEQNLSLAVAEFTCRFLQPHLLKEGVCSYADLSASELAAEAERLQVVRDVCAKLVERAKIRLEAAQEIWRASAAEMARRFLKPPATAVEIERPDRSFRLWYGQDGEPIVAIQKAACE